MLSTNAMHFVYCLSGCCAVSLPPKSTYIRFTSSCCNLCLPFIAVTKISCQKASCLWQPTVATARSHLAWRQERKHFRHECQESFLEAPIVSLFHSLFISDRCLSFLLLCPSQQRNYTNSSCKRLSSFIGNKVPKDEECPFPKDKHEEDGIG